MPRHSVFDEVYDSVMVVTAPLHLKVNRSYVLNRTKTKLNLSLERTLCANLCSALIVKMQSR